MTLELMEGLGYCVNILPPSESGRTYISKGFLEQAKKCTDYNVALYHDKISFETPLLGKNHLPFTFIGEYQNWLLIKGCKVYRKIATQLKNFWLKK